MPEINYQELYENEKRRREEAEQKYNDLRQRVKPLLDTIEKMAEPASKISAVMQEFEKLQQTEREQKASPE